MKTLQSLRVHQLDEEFDRIDALRDRPAPDQGWIRTIREALGMSIRQMAERAGISYTAAQSAEMSEAKGTIQLDTLRTLADALGCELRYAVLPRTSLAETLEDRADLLASRIVERVSDSMELEEQGIHGEEIQRQKDEIKSDLIREQSRDFWDD